MEINNTTISIYYTNCALGFAPYSLARDKFNQFIHVKFNRFLCIYSAILLTVFAALTNYGLYFDTNSEFPIRMKSPTSRVVTGFDVNIVVGSCIIGMLSSVFGLRNTQQMNFSLNQADLKLMGLCENIPLHTNRAKRRSTLFVCILYVYMGCMLALDVLGYVRLAAKLRLRDQKAVSIDQNVYCFVPFYFMYVLFLTLHMKFAYSTYRIGLRYREMNSALKNSLAYQSALWIFREPVSRASIAMPWIRHNFIGTSQSTVGKVNYNAIILRTPDEIINQFADIHELLGKAMVNVSSEFGVTILVLLISCLLHLVVTAYFFFLEIFGEQDIYFSTVQMLWIIFHIVRLLLIVEPCHLVAIEAGRTIKIVSDLLRTKGEHYALKNFWQQLLADKTIFSACGICRIDRRLLTKLGGAIATYLVILLQFQRAAESTVPVKTRIFVPKTG